MILTEFLTLSNHQSIVIMKVLDDKKREMLQKVIAAYTTSVYTNIDLKAQLEDYYIIAEVKINFCKHLCRIWPGTKINQLTQGLFVKYKTGEDLLKILKS